MINTLNKVIALILIFMNLGLAESKADDCPQPVSLITKGQPAICYGYLFSPTKEKELFNINEQYKILQQEDAIKDKQIDDYKTQVTNLNSAVNLEEQKTQIWQNRAVDITEKYTKESENKGTHDLLMIGLGILLTIGAGYAIGQASRH